MELDPFLQNIDSSERQIAKEFLKDWLPFLTKDLCEGCEAVLIDRIQSLNPVINGRNPGETQEEEVDRGVKKLDLGYVEEFSDVAGGFDGYSGASHEGWENIKATGWDSDPAPKSPKVRMSWADMFQQDQLEEEQEEKTRRKFWKNGMEGEKEVVRRKKNEMSRGQSDKITFTSVGRKTDFVCFERIDGRIVNILEGLELHNGVFSAVEQKKTLDFIYELQEKGRNEEQGEHTYSEDYKPRKDFRGKGRSTFQFGCYNSIEHKRSARGINHGMAASPMPKFFKVMIKQLIDRHVIPASCEPDSCRVDIYEPDDFLPPDNSIHDFVRPFCTASFLNDCCINFGSNLAEDDAGEFIGSTAILLPVGSVLVLDGKTAAFAKHCVPAAPSRRITLTFLKTENWSSMSGHSPDLQNTRSNDVESHDEANGTKFFAEIRTIGTGRMLNGRSNRVKVQQHTQKVGDSVFDRLTPAVKSHNPSADMNSATYHSSNERARHSRSVLAGEADELPGSHRHGWSNDDGVQFNRHEISSERSMRVDQKRIIITRNFYREEDSFPSTSNSAHPRVCIRASKNNQRRVRVIQ